MRSYIAELEKRGWLKRITAEVSAELEVTAISSRVLEAKGPALLFENVKGHDMPLLSNLFGTPERIALGMGLDSVEGLKDIGELLATLKEPEPPKGVKDAWAKLPTYRKVLHMAPKVVKKAPWQEVTLVGDEVDLNRLPIQTCWPGDAAPLITWGLVITKGPNKERHNLGIYRQQLIEKNNTTKNWLTIFKLVISPHS